MPIADYLAFFVFVLTIVFTPGPMTLFMMAKGFHSDFKQLGVILLGANNAYLVMILVFSLGVDTLLRENIMVMRIVQVLGVLFLCYLAYKQWNKVFPTEKLDIALNKKSSYFKLYTSGLFVGLTNPQAIFVFALIFPQFIEEGSNQLLQLAIIGTTFLILQFSSGSCYALFGKFIQHFLVKPSHRKTINHVCSIVYVLIALLLALNIR